MQQQSVGQPMARGDWWRNPQRLLVRLPGTVVAGVWLALFLGTLGVARLVEAKRQAYVAVQVAHEQAGEIVSQATAQGYENPLEVLRRIGAKTPEEKANANAASASQSALAAMLVWLLALAVWTVSTAGWVTAKDGWTKVRSWHGAKLVILYLTLTAASVLVAVASTSSVDPFDTTVLVASALLLMAGGAMLVRATWNWLTGRENEPHQMTADPAAPLRSLMRRPVAAALWLGLGLIVGAVAGFVIAEHPTTYADCVLRGLKHASTATATAALERACRQDYGVTSRQR